MKSIRPFIAAFIVFSALAASISTANAGVLFAPISVANTPPGEFNPAYAAIHIIDQSGLSANYVSGVTDFSSFVAGTTSVDAELANTAFGSVNDTGPGPIDFDFDFGTVISLTRMALWNDDDSQGIGSFTLFSATDGTFSTLTSLGNFNALIDSTLPLVAQVFDPTDATARFFRMRATAFNPTTNLMNFGEVAFEAAASVPEPTTTALLALGLLGAGVARKRRTH